MQRELALMKDVGSHTHVVNLLGYVPLQSPLIVLEYCANGDLLAYLRAHLQAHKAAVTSVLSRRKARCYAVRFLGQRRAADRSVHEHCRHSEGPSCALLADIGRDGK